MTTLHDNLADLTADQPLQPPDRLGAVTRHARRIRRTRAALSVGVVLAVAIPFGLQLRQPQTATFAGTSVSSWPDRSQRADRPVAEGAFASYAAGRDVVGGPRWLFRGTVDLPDGEDVYVAVFTVDLMGPPTFDPAKETLSTLVTSFTDRSRVDEEGVDVGGAGVEGSPWTYRETGLHAQPDTNQVSLYRSTITNENLLFLLADPQARTLRWASQPLPYAVTLPGVVVAGQGTTRSDDGVFVADIGALTGPVTVTVADGHGRTRPVVPAGGEGPGPILVAPPRPDLPVGFEENGSGTGTTSRESDGRWDATSLGVYLDHRPTVSVYLRCYGGGTLRATLDDSSVDEVSIAPSRVAPPPKAQGAAACDGQSHRTLGPVPVLASGYLLRLFTDRLQSYSYAVGSER